MTRKTRGLPAVVIAFVIMSLWPKAASANMGVPYLFYVFTAAGFLLIPVILIEALVLKNRLSLTYNRASLVSTMANLGSAVVGAVLLFAGEVAFAEAGFGAHYGWKAKIPFFLMFIPSYAISVYIEAAIGRPIIRARSTLELLSVFAIANVYSYALLLIAALIITVPPY